MAPSPQLVRTASIFAALLAASACRTSGEAKPDPGPSLPPPAVAAAPRGEVTEEDVKDVHVVRAEELLIGRFAGVEVLPLPSGGVSVRIRGATSLSLSTEPLYV